MNKLNVLVLGLAGGIAVACAGNGDKDGQSAMVPGFGSVPGAGGSSALGPAEDSSIGGENASTGGVNASLGGSESAATDVGFNGRPNRVWAVARAAQAVYGQAVSNLQVHEPELPSVEYLRSISVMGQRGYGIADVGTGRDSEGSELIIAAVDKDDPRSPKGS